VKTIIKDKTEWDEFIDSVCRSYGFDRQTCPIVYTLEGHLIGDGNDFVEYMKDKYGIKVDLTKESIKARQRLNVQETEDRMRRLQGLTLGEKIQAFLAKKAKKNVANNMNDCFYHMEMEAGVPFFVRRTNVLRELNNSKYTAQRTFNVPDLGQEKEEADALFQEAEASRDTTWDEFLTMFTEHIEGKVDPTTRTAGRKDKDLQPAGANAVEEEEDDEAEVVSRPRSTITADSQKYDPAAERKKYAISDDCKLEFLKLNKIEPMGDDYLLVSHPYPQIEGEMLIFQPNADDKCDKDLLVYRDYSLKKRNKYFNPRYQLSAAQKKEKEEKMMTSTKLQCLEIASDDPLSPCDWKHMATIV